MFSILWWLHYPTLIFFTILLNFEVQWIIFFLWCRRLKGFVCNEGISINAFEILEMEAPGNFDICDFRSTVMCSKFQALFDSELLL
jgi:hypothetical protein